ncbi:putative cell cycle inhibitor Nif1 [Cladophialophora carrionii]|uniref:Putative cell cycle inhibitor Nif1 n=1 Tax=Cladophialophora carrionii TaxID=86049 RepID=A0A1C1CI58_9EURO|nr:putative cell cycle inhibitor Nif1 [Cladophialophora carrionii]
MSRPNYIEIPSDNSRSASALSRSGFSPRIQHFDGDVPPALSPLDAIAARSRKLAKELEETRKAGERRMSRLSPQIVTDSLTEHQNNRPPIFRALSDGLDTVPPLPVLEKDRGGNFARVAHPLNRPASQRIRMGSIASKAADEADSKPLSPVQDYFGAPRVESPPPLEPRGPQSPPQISESPSLHPQPGLSRQISSTSQSELSGTLAPPRSHSDRLRPYQDSDDDYTSSNAGSTFSQSRKLSSSSGFSAPHSPLSPYLQFHGRTPSSGSLDSPTKPTLTRNFSRPLSSASLSNLRAEKSPSKATFANRMSQLRPANSFDNATSAPNGYLAGEASSYTHATYSLPRGKDVPGRTSQLFSALSTPHFEWQEPMFPGTPPLEGKSSTELPVPSPMASARPSREDQTQRSGLSFELNAENPLVGPDRPSPATAYYTPTGSLRSNDSAGSRPSLGQLPPPPSGFMLPPTPLSPVEEMSHSSRSTSTVRPTTARSGSNYQGLSTDDHVTKAIELHEDGKLNESTYHLRIAANRGHATAMLLYALACRHGWGLRANPKEGVQWLRKAVDCAMLDIAEDEDPASRKPGVDYHERRAHRAQFALSVYELGVSHLNGWGVEQDKTLALRCFEIAGNWGDTDALSEAGFCYAEGIGCKKDMKKAAKFYRMAEAKGVSMVGNSWIYKAKYNDSDDEGERARSAGKTSSPKPRSKSKSRGIFGRKKATPQP